MMDDDTSTSAPRSRRPRTGDGDTLSDAGVVAVVVVLAVVLAAGYLFAMKMIAVSKLDDCILGHRRNCEPPLAP